MAGSDAENIVRLERTAKRLRATRAGQVVVDTERARLVWADRPWPQLWVPDTEVAPSVRRVGVTSDDPRLTGFVRLPDDAVDTWFEEDEELIGHVRDPHHRIDALPSSRHVVVAVDGVVLADSRASVVVHETGLIPRTYLPIIDVRMDLLLDSTTVTVCPYKGRARYHHVEVAGHQHEDLVWSYPFPLRESAPIAGRVCFDDQRVHVTIDGVVREPPTSPLLRDLPEPPRTTRFSS